MRKVILSSLALISFTLPCHVFGEEVENENIIETKSPETVVQKPSAPAKTNEAISKPETKKVAFDAFTGKITKNKVRLRVQPNYEGPVVRELESGELFVIQGETEDFYAVQPPAGSKAYIFRTFVLDNKIEGNRVNVRLKPDLESPVVARLNSGDNVNGVVDQANPKWLEIKMPDSARYYVAKEYVQKVGDPHLLTRIEKRRENVMDLLKTTNQMAQSELQKSFPDINIEGVKGTYQRVLNDYSDVPEAVMQANEALVSLQNQYTAKKINYLESHAQNANLEMMSKTQQLNEELELHKSKINHLQQQLESGRQSDLNPSFAAQSAPVITSKPVTLPFNMSNWIPVEEGLFAAWSAQTGYADPQAFYHEQSMDSIVLRGVVEPYNRPVKNKPGDFMLMNSSNNLPIAFLYSTQVNLQDYIGHEVAVRVVSRPNNHYAFPAYFVLSLE